MKRITVIDVTGEDPILLINPVILETSGEQTGNEGCLSVPGKTGVVTRPNYVKVRAYDENLRPFEIEGTELLARAFCHEIEHLDGHMYYEKVEGPLLTEEEVEKIMEQTQGYPLAIEHCVDVYFRMWNKKLRDGRVTDQNKAEDYRPSDEDIQGLFSDEKGKDGQKVVSARFLQYYTLQSGKFSTRWFVWEHGRMTFC